jgi:hypothetical protein
MATIARGLARALEGWQQGRMVRDQREQVQLEREQRRALLELQMQQMREVAARQAAQEARATREEQRSAVGAGMLPLDALGAQDMPGATPRTPVFQQEIGGQPYGMAELPDQRQHQATMRATIAARQLKTQEAARQKAQEQAQDSAVRQQALATLPPPMQRVLEGLPTAQLLEVAGKRADRLVNPPREPQRQPLTQQGGDGFMYYSEDGGRNWRRGNVEGLDGSADPPPPRPAPAAAPPGDTLLRGLGISGPSASAPTPVASGAQPAAQPRGPFGRATAQGDATAQSKFQASEQAAQELVAMLQEYRTKLEEVGPQWTAGRDPRVNDLQSLAMQIKLKYKGPDFAGLGVLAGPDMEVLDAVLASPTGLNAKVKGTGGLKAQINSVIGNVERGRRIRYQLSGRPGEYAPLDVPDAGGDLNALRQQYRRQP